MTAVLVISADLVVIVKQAKPSGEAHQSAEHDKRRERQPKNYFGHAFVLSQIFIVVVVGWREIRQQQMEPYCEQAKTQKIRFHRRPRQIWFGHEAPQSKRQASHDLSGCMMTTQSLG
jgi:hypothetical protein